MKFVKNLKTELEQGKPMKSLSIAYAMKKKANKMAKGGHVKGVHEEAVPNSKTRRAGSTQGSTLGESRDLGFESRMAKDYPSSMKIAKEHAKNKLKELKSMPNPKLKGLAEGGAVSPFDKAGADISNSISASNAAKMASAFGKKMAEGGEVDHDLVDRIMYSEGGQIANELEEGEAADVLPNEFDDLVLDDHLEPEFKGEGNEVGEEKAMDLAARILKKKR